MNKSWVKSTGGGLKRKPKGKVGLERRKYDCALDPSDDPPQVSFTPEGTESGGLRRNSFEKVESRP